MTACEEMDLRYYYYYFDSDVHATKRKMSKLLWEVE